MRGLPVEHAKTLATQATELESKASEADFSSSLYELFATLDQNTFSWRTFQRCLFEEWIEFSASWPRAGTMRNGNVYRHQPLVHTTTETGFSFWPTARAQARGSSRNRVRDRNHNYNIEDWCHILLVHAGWNEATGLKMNPEWLEWWMGFPPQYTLIEELKDAETQSTQG